MIKTKEMEWQVKPVSSASCRTGSNSTVKSSCLTRI